MFVIWKKCTLLTPYPNNTGTTIAELISTILTSADHACINTHQNISNAIVEAEQYSTLQYINNSSTILNRVITIMYVYVHRAHEFKRFSAGLPYSGLFYLPWEIFPFSSLNDVINFYPIKL